MTNHQISVISRTHPGEDVETIDLDCNDCGRVIYLSDGVDPDVTVLTKAAARHRRDPEWIEQSAARFFLQEF